MNINNINFPSWLENSRLFRTAFLLRKLFFTRSVFHHYAQFAEDVSIARLFPPGYQGFFVDVGCFHPKKYSNTWRLYRSGWRGVNIDIDPVKISGFNLLRRGDVNIACAVSDHDGHVTYYANGFYSLTVSLDEDYVAAGSGYVEKQSRCARLTTLLDETRFKDRQIDFLSVDAEGHDRVVLESLDFQRYSPKLIAVETHQPLFSQVSESALYKFLAEKDYCLVGWCGLTLLMASPGFQQELCERRATA